jgi:hypothetical protein
LKVTINIDCTPQEARVFMGLPDVSPLNDHLVSEMQKRMDENINAMRPEELMKSWMTVGGQAQESFLKMMQAAAGGG